MNGHWPLIERELLRAGRHEATYVVRVIAPVMAMVMLALAYLFQWAYSDDVDAETIASHIWTICFLGQYWITYLFVPWAASRALADEARDGTLNLLSLAEKSHLELYASKFAALWLQAIALLLSLVPLQVLRAVIHASGSDPVVLSLGRTAVAAAFVCAIALFYSVLLKRGGLAFVATLATLFVGRSLLSTLVNVLPVQAQAIWHDEGIGPFLSVIVLAVAAVPAAIGTVAVLRRPDFEIFKSRWRGRRAPLPIPTKAAACVSRIVVYEAGGIATFAQSWWGRVLTAAVLVVVVYSFHVPSEFLIAALAGAEAFVVGKNLRQKKILDDLMLTAAEPRTLATGLVRGQFYKAVVFVPAIVATFTLPSLYRELSPLVAVVQARVAPNLEAVTPAVATALLGVILVAYAVLLTYLFTAVGIHYSIAGCSTARMIGNLVVLGMIISVLISMIPIGYYLLSQMPNLPTTPPPPPFVATLGEVVAALVILPIVAVDYMIRIVRQFASGPEDTS
jgi:ABC-type transport system involved in multi-copper enzyme maturation permease subunit